MSPTLITRAATVADIPTIVRQRRRMFESMGLLDVARNDKADALVRRYLEAAIPQGEYRGWLVEVPGGQAIAGIGLIVRQHPPSSRNLSGRSSYLLSLYVEPEHRRHGIARHLVRAMIDWSRAQGITEVALHASEQGRRLYESLGFRQTNEMRLFLDQTAIADV